MEKLNVALMDAPDLRHPSEGWELIQEFTASLRCRGTAALALYLHCFFILSYVLLVLAVFICILMGQITFKKKVRVLTKLVQLNGILICAAVVEKQLCLSC